MNTAILSTKHGTHNRPEWKMCCCGKPIAFQFYRMCKAPFYLVSTKKIHTL